MQEAKHSPSPWNNGLDANGNLIMFQDERVTGEDRNEVYQANRRLLDVAPELLETLADALNQIKALDEDYDQLTVYIDGMAVIAKATVSQQPE